MSNYVRPSHNSSQLTDVKSKKREIRHTKLNKGNNGQYQTIPMAKFLPHDLMAEQSVLGAIFLENAALDKVMEIIFPKDFYRPAHREIFQAMIDLHNLNEQIDLVTLKDLLHRKGLLSQCGGISYLMSLMDVTPTAVNVAGHARIVKDKALRRSLIQAGHRIVAEGYEEN
ncbi:MAG: hypothetical protein JXA79_07530, partial [Deltaproteobacteria bacterium]|nr:hypothetical protein [Deltaproteobacteria bacterium]